MDLSARGMKATEAWPTDYPLSEILAGTRKKFSVQRLIRMQVGDGLATY
jgi:hypothetical protein